MELLGSMASFLHDVWLAEKELYLVGGFTPVEKYARQFGSFFRGSGSKKKCLKPPPSLQKEKENHLQK